jgi:hypothetical protein
MSLLPLRHNPFIFRSLSKPITGRLQGKETLIEMLTDQTDGTKGHLLEIRL